MLDRKQQMNDFLQGKQLNAQEKGLSDFFDPRIDPRSKVFLDKPLDPNDKSAEAFLGSIPLHNSAKDFLGD